MAGPVFHGTFTFDRETDHSTKSTLFSIFTRFFFGDKKTRQNRSRVLREYTGTQSNRYLLARSNRWHTSVASSWPTLETYRLCPAHVTRPSPHIAESCRTASSPETNHHCQEEQGPPLVFASLHRRPHSRRVAVPHLAMRCSMRRRMKRRPACSCASRP